MKKMNVDCEIRRKSQNENLEFYFNIEHVTSPSNFYISIKNGDGEEYYRIKVVNYLYGRITIGNDSYFAELMGFIDPDNPKQLTYHIVYVDPSFDEKYDRIDTYSRINDNENYEFL